MSESIPNNSYKYTKHEKNTKFLVTHSWSNETASITKGEFLYFLKDNSKNPGWLLVNREGYDTPETTKLTDRFWAPENYLELTGHSKNNKSMDNQPVPRERRSTLNSGELNRELNREVNQAINKTSNQANNYEIFQPNLDSQSESDMETLTSTPVPVPRKRKSIKMPKPLQHTGTLHEKPGKTIENVTERLETFGIELNSFSEVKSSTPAPPPPPDVSLKPKLNQNISLSSHNTPVNGPDDRFDYSIEEYLDNTNNGNITDLGSRSISMDSLVDLIPQPVTAPVRTNSPPTFGHSQINRDRHTFAHNNHSPITVQTRDLSTQNRFKSSRPVSSFIDSTKIIVPATSSVQTLTTQLQNSQINLKHSPTLPASQAQSAYSKLHKEGFLKWRSIRAKSGELIKNSGWNQNWTSLGLRQNSESKVVFQLVFYNRKKAKADNDKENSPKTCFILKDITVQWLTKNTPDSDLKTKKPHVFTLTRGYDKAKIALSFETQNESEDWHRYVTGITLPDGENFAQSIKNSKSRTLDSLSESSSRVVLNGSQKTLPRNLKISPQESTNPPLPVSHSRENSDNSSDRISATRFQTAISFLTNFFSRRPNNHQQAIKHLIEHRFFGMNVHENVAEETSEAAKTFLTRLSSVIESHKGDGGGLSTEGLYRINAEVTKVQKYRLIIDQNSGDPDVYSKELSKEENIHNLTGLLKSFFREMSENLIPNDFLFLFNSIHEENLSLDKLDQRVYEDIFSKLPVLGQELLILLFNHLRIIIETKHNAMDQANVARIFGPTLCDIMPEDISDHAKMQRSSVYANNLIDAMLTLDFLKLLE